jgi:hypothetical protein
VTLYHHTSLAHIPYIIADAELVGTRGSALWPVDFVWATTDERGDRTTACCKPGKRLPRVRISFADDMFLPWLDAVQERTDWDVTLTQRLIAAADKMGQPHEPWHAAMGPIPLGDMINIEMKNWDGPWKPFDMADIKELPAQWIGFTAGGHRWRVNRRYLTDKTGTQRLNYLADDLGRI